MKIIIDHHTISGIPVLEFYNAEALGKLLMVIILHGFTGRKEDHLLHGYMLACQDFFAVAVDLPMHGELGDPSATPAQVSPHLVEIAMQTMDLLDRLVDIYSIHPLADTSRMGLLGISLGGTFIYFYLSRRRANYKSAATLISGATPFLAKTFRGLQIHFPHFGVTDEFITFIESLAPQFPFLEGVKDFPLLIQNGAQDPIIPIDEVRKMVTKARMNYSKPELLELIDYPEYGHDNPLIMYQKAIEWFRKTL